MRTHPVTRTEVRVHFNWSPDCPQILAIPLDACDQDGQGQPPILELFGPVMEEIAEEWRAWRGKEREPSNFFGGADPQARVPVLADHDFTIGVNRICRACGAEFVTPGDMVENTKLDDLLPDPDKMWVRKSPRLYYCSNHCANTSAKRSVAHAQAKLIERRSVERLKARAGLKCQWCGEPLKAERGTKRYCSGKCRVAALRARQISAEQT